MFTVASVGDSICILSRGGRVVKMNKMHRVDAEDERRRVIESGGTIVNSRVNGVLAVTRAFGDVAFKYETSSSAYGTGPINSVPEVASEIITPMTEFAVIASDGLFDVLEFQQVVNFVRKRSTNKVDIQTITKELVDLAIKEGSVDNVSAIILFFHASLSNSSK